MARKPRNLFLYLTLVCFFSLIAIFFFDGYMGIYDTIRITAGEREQFIDPDFRSRQDTSWSTSVSWGEKAFFSYEFDNRHFAVLTQEVAASLWQSQEKLQDLVIAEITVASFGKTTLEWSLDSAALVTEAEAQERSHEYTVLITRGGLERKVVVFINPAPQLLKPAPPPVR